MNFEAPKLGKSILLLIAGMAFGILVPAILVIILKVLHLDSNFISKMALLLGEALIPIPIIIWAIIKKYNLKSVFRFNKVKWNYTIYTVLAGIGMIFVLDEVDRLMDLFVTMPDYMQQLEELMQFSDLSSTILLISSIAIIGPLTEEMMFRGFFLQSLEKNLKNITSAVVYTAVAFMISHFNIYWALSIFFSGFFLSFVGWKTNSIWPALIVHAVNNSLSLAYMHYQEIVDPVVSFHGHSHPVLFLTGLFLLVFFIRKLTRLETCA